MKSDYDEKQAFGKISWRIYVEYFKHGAGYFGSILVMFLFLATKILIMCADYYVSEWATDEESHVIKCKSDLLNKNNNSAIIQLNSLNSSLSLSNQTSTAEYSDELVFSGAFLVSRFYHFKIYSCKIYNYKILYRNYSIISP